MNTCLNRHAHDFDDRPVSNLSVSLDYQGLVADRLRGCLERFLQGLQRRALVLKEQ